MDGRTTALPFVRREEFFPSNPLLPGFPQSFKIQAPSLGKPLHHSQSVVQLGAPVSLNELFQGAATHVKALATGLGVDPGHASGRHGRFPVYSKRGSRIRRDRVGWKDKPRRA